MGGFKVIVIESMPTVVIRKINPPSDDHTFMPIVLGFEISIQLEQQDA